MSALTDDISRHHWRLGFSDPGTDVCMCGWRQGRDNGQIGYNRHLIDVTEAALREQIAASCNKLAVVEGEHGRSNYAEIWQEAAEIARGRS